MADIVSLYEAKTQLSRLVDRAAAGEEIVITKNGVPFAKLIAAPSPRNPRRPAHALGRIRDLEKPDPEIERLFYDGAVEPPEERPTGRKPRVKGR